MAKWHPQQELLVYFVSMRDEAALVVGTGGFSGNDLLVCLY